MWFIFKFLGPHDIIQWLLNQWSVYKTSNRKVSFLQKMCLWGNKEYRLENQESTSLNYIHFTAFAVGVFFQNFPTTAFWVFWTCLSQGWCIINNTSCYIILSKSKDWWVTSVTCQIWEKHEIFVSMHLHMRYEFYSLLT